MKRKTKNNIYKLIIIVVIIIGAIFSKDYLNYDKNDEAINNLNSKSSVTTSEENPLINVDGNLQIHFIDVGQADSILIKQDNNYMLIDGGNNEDGDMLVKYLKEQGVEKLDYIIATHPHEDHIGGLDDVLNEFDTDLVLMPDKITTTKTFEDFLLAIKNRQDIKNKNGENVTLKKVPKLEEKYNLGNASFVIYAPNSSSYDELNNYSIVIKLSFGNNTFLFTGDAEKLSEKEMLDKNYDLKADVLKIGHHGSSTSTSDEFLEAVSPKYAVLSVGEDNSYNLPKKTVMDKFKNNNIPVYRTDEQGTIILNSDGTNITFNKEAGTYSYMK